jgi:hypothetical protein
MIRVAVDLLVIFTYSQAQKRRNGPEGSLIIDDKPDGSLGVTSIVDERVLAFVLGNLSRSRGPSREEYFRLSLTHGGYYTEPRVDGSGSRKRRNLEGRTKDGVMDSMSFLNSLKSLVVEEDDKNGPQAAPQTPVPSKGSVPPQPPTGTAAPETADRAMEEQLLQKVVSDAVPAVRDMFAHMSTLIDIVPDEGMRYKAAIKLTLNGGHTLVELENNIDTCLGKLDTHDNEFQAELAVQITKKVESHRGSAKKAQDAIEAARKQIQEIETQIGEYEKTVQSELDTASNQEREILGVRARFAGSLFNVRRTLKDQRNILSGDTDQKEMFDMALENLASDYAMKLGEIEEFMDASDGFIKSVDLENGVYEVEALSELAKWDNRMDKLLEPGAPGVRVSATMVNPKVRVGADGEEIEDEGENRTSDFAHLFGPDSKKK